MCRLSIFRRHRWPFSPLAIIAATPLITLPDAAIDYDGRHTLFDAIIMLIRRQPATLAARPASRIPIDMS